MTADLEVLTDEDLQALMFLLGRLRGPGVVDPALPVDPDNERYSLGVREWANERMCELADERRRREVDGRRRRANMLREGFSE